MVEAALAAALPAHRGRRRAQRIVLGWVLLGLAAFVLLTLTVVSGLFFSEQLFGRPLQFTHKSVFSLLGWLTFGALLFGRWRYGWRGRVALRWIIAGTVFVFLAYLGYKFVLEVVLGR